MPLTFELDGVDYTVPSSAYLVDNLNNVTCQVMVTYNTNTTSGSGVVLGTPFIRQYYTYFDYTN